MKISLHGAWFWACEVPTKKVAWLFLEPTNTAGRASNRSGWLGAKAHLSGIHGTGESHVPCGESEALLAMLEGDQDPSKSVEAELWGDGA